MLIFLIIRSRTIHLATPIRLIVLLLESKLRVVSLSTILFMVITLVIYQIIIVHQVYILVPVGQYLRTIFYIIT